MGLLNCNLCPLHSGECAADHAYQFLVRRAVGHDLERRGLPLDVGIMALGRHRVHREHSGAQREASCVDLPCRLRATAIDMGSAATDKNVSDCGTGRPLVHARHLCRGDTGGGGPSPSARHHPGGGGRRRLRRRGGLDHVGVHGVRPPVDLGRNVHIP